MTTATPLRIVLCHSGTKDSWGTRTATSLDLILFGDPGKDRETRWEPLDLAAAVPLETEAETFAAPPPQPVAGYLDAVLHTVVVALVDDDLLADTAWMDWFDQCLKHLGTEEGRHAVLPVVRERTHGRWPADWVQSLAERDLGEEAERVELLALRVLQTVLDTLICGGGGGA